MEYEQVEYGCRIVTEALTRQDINGYYDLLAPDVLLVTHFPYPARSSDNNLQTIQDWMQLLEQAKSRRKGMTTKGAGATGAVHTSANGADVSSSKRRAGELLQEQEALRAGQQKRYEAYRMRREGHHGGGSGGSTGENTEESPGKLLAKNAAATATTGKAAANATEKARSDGGAKGVNHASGGGRGGSLHGGSRMPLGVRWFLQQQQQQQQQQPDTIHAQPSANTAASWHQAADETGATPTGASGVAMPADPTNAKKSISTLRFEDCVHIAEGRLSATYRFYELLEWMRSGKHTRHIAPIAVDLQLRKDILQEDEVLPPPPLPSRIEERYAQLGTQYTDRNQPLSCMTVTWGSDFLLFRDKLYFDDGAVVTIQRTMLPTQEILARAAAVMPAGSISQSSSRAPQQQQQQALPQQPRLSEKTSRSSAIAAAGHPSSGLYQGILSPQAEQVCTAVEAFYGVTASRVNTTNNTWPLLDFSFVEAPEPSQLLRHTPQSGHVHVGKLPRVAADPRNAQGVFLNRSNDPTVDAAAAGGARTLIKAKNKHGDEEAYEFSDKHNRFSFAHHNSAGGSGRTSLLDGEPGDGAAGRASGVAGGGPKSRKSTGAGASGSPTVHVRRYDASSVRISGCHLSARVDQLLPVLRRLVANCLLTLHTLDLSQNSISTLPDLSLLPLQNLKLHDNVIADWKLVEARVASLPYLSILTLHGNPIAEEQEVSRSAALMAGAGRGFTGSIAPASARHKAKGATPAAAAAATASAASSQRGSGGESTYWRKLLALLLNSPARVVPLRQVDFVTLTAEDFNVAGAYSLFTTGKAEVLTRARTLETAASLKRQTAARAM